MEVASELEVVPRLRWAVMDMTLVLMVVMKDSNAPAQAPLQAGKKKGGARPWPRNRPIVQAMPAA